MAVRIHNSLTKKKEEFAPLDPPKVKLYSCGVTVYDDCHIGHARSLYIFEVIRRYLQFRGFDVRFVRNITDIDDKIINRANELTVDWKELVAKYIGRYYEDLQSLGLEKADIEPRATENIPDMIKHIGVLIEKGFAYQTATGVYFSVRKFKEYGRLSGQGIEQMLTGVRKDADETKEDPLDFALWKTSKPAEPFWPSPWGNGRPGWHIECSVMSAKYLKSETLDIHAGGRDLIFPHHENEIAQAEALTGKPFARYWIHHGLLTIDGQKMSKSLGNFVTIKDFLAKHHYADVLKLFFLSTHYSHPIDYTDDKIKEAKQALDRVINFNEEITRRLSGHQSKTKQATIKEIEEIKNNFIEAMDDDFNTPRGLASIFDLVSCANKNIEKLDFIYNAQTTIKELLGIFGISLMKIVYVGVKNLDASVNVIQPDIIIKNKDGSAIVIEVKFIEAKIAERNEAREHARYNLADEIRRELEEKGIILKDTKDGTTWRRKL
ncbi:MAG: cysteine--tRNA ligase [Candidatus Omnitrophica bacterium]|nr:cysteine--tRNA ligase [Candidatus Omnitrophota bacterium]